MHLQWTRCCPGRGNVPVKWYRTGCKPDLELSCRRYCVVKVVFLKPCCDTCTGSQARGPAQRRRQRTARRARASHMSCRSGPLQALLFWRCSDTSMSVAGYRLSTTGARPVKQSPAKDTATIRIEGLFLLCCCNDVCYEVSILICTYIDFSLEAYQNRSLVLTTTSGRSWIPIMVMVMIGINDSSIQSLPLPLSEFMIR